MDLQALRDQANVDLAILAEEGVHWEAIGAAIMSLPEDTQRQVLTAISQQAAPILAELEADIPASYAQRRRYYAEGASIFAVNERV